MNKHIVPCLLLSAGLWGHAAHAAELTPGGWDLNLNSPTLYLGANVSLVETGAALYFSNGQADPTTLPVTKPASVGQAVGVFNTMKLGLTATGSAGEVQLIEKQRTVGSLSRLTRTVVGIETVGERMTVSTVNAVLGVQQVNLKGGLQLAGFYLDEVSAGGQLALQGLSVDTSDPGRVKVSGQMSGAAITNGAANAEQMPEYGSTNTFGGVIWESTQLTGPTTLPLYEVLAATDLNDTSWLQQRGYTILAEDMIVAGGEARKMITLQSTQLISGLQMTDGALATLGASFGLTPDLVGAAAINSVNGSGGWGTLKVTSTFKVYNNCLECYLQPPIPLPTVPSVPEPSTWGLLAMGLMGVGWVARRQRQAVQGA